MTADDVFDEVFVATRHAYPPLPDLRVVERPGWLQIITPSIRTGGLNEVIYSHLDPREADAVIDATIAEYRALGLKFRWNGGPGTAPADLGERLSRRGLEVSWGRGMARSTETSGQPREPAIAIAEVDASTVEVYSDVMAAGWSLERGPFAAASAAILATPGCRHRLFLATWDGEPAATAGYVAFARSAHLVGGVVLPAFRGRGLYRALVAARLEHARAAGLTLATSHARESTSAPILDRMGFDTIRRFPMYFG